MELRQLESFVLLAELRSFTRAAEALSLTQPAVTRQVAALEQELHTRLLERMGRRVRLTAAGEVLLPYARTMVRLVEEAVRAVSDVSSGTAGRLAVGVNSTTATYLLPPLLRRFRETHPGVELSIHTGVSAQIAELVQAGSVDLGLVTGSHAHADLVATPLAEYETGVVVYPEHPLAQSSPRGGEAAGVCAADLAGSPLILMEQGTNLRSYVDRLLSAAGMEEQVSLELDNVEAIKKMIEAGLGISLLPLFSVQAEVDAGRLVALPLAGVPGAHRGLSVLYRKDKYLSAAIRAFQDLLNLLSDA